MKDRYKKAKSRAFTASILITCMMFSAAGAFVAWQTLGPILTMATVAFAVFAIASFVSAARHFNDAYDAEMQDITRGQRRF